MLSNARLGHDDEGWFPAKDIATVDEAGYLFITGSFDDTIISGGENIAPAELEDVLVEHPDADELPTNATGKLLRREIIESLRDVNADK